MHTRVLTYHRVLIMLYQPMSYMYTCASFLVILDTSVSHVVLLNRIIHPINLL